MIRHLMVSVGGALLLAACGTSKEAAPAPDFGPEAGGKDDSATQPAVTGAIGYDGVVSFALGSGVNWRAWVFPGNQGQIVDAHVQGLDGADTVAYLYKISRITGRPYGRPLGYNDDTDQPAWSLQKGVGDFNPYSSSILGVVLPDDRDYALLVTTYHQAGGSALAQVHSHGAVLPTTIPLFNGTGAAKSIVFTDDQTHATVLTADQYPVSPQVKTAMAGSGITMTGAVYRADPSALAAVMADARHLALAYSFLYSETNADAYDASWTLTNATDAADSLLTAWGDDPTLRPVVTFVLKSMFKDSAFRASDVTVYRIHWDNGDDTNAEGIAAVKASTGEIRVLSLVNPA